MTTAPGRLAAAGAASTIDIALNFGFDTTTALTSGNCSVGTDGAAVERFLDNMVIEPGDKVVRTFPFPLLVKPTGSARYCLGLRVGHIGGAQTSLYLSTLQLTAFAASGTYTGTGSGADTGAAAPASPVLQTR